MKTFALSLALLVAGGPLAAAETARKLEIAGAQFPAPRSELTDREWFAYVTGYFHKYNAWSSPPSYVARPGFGIEGPSLKPTVLPGAPIIQRYSDLDAQGRPMWFDGSQTNELDDLVHRLFVQERFDDLERLLADWTDGKERTADGRWKLSWFLDATNAGASQPGDHEALLARLHRWRDKYPHSPFPVIAEAYRWRAAAWRARGSGYSSSVTPEGWRLFHERSRKAEQILLASRAYASDNPLWGYVYLETSPGLGWTIEQQLAFFRKQMDQEPSYYPSYFAMMEYLHPRWGGDWKLIETLVEYAEAKTRATDGASLYARIYWYLAQREGVDFDIFEHGRVDWPRMKKGFEDILERFPHSAWDMNSFAAFACRAHDGDTYRSLRFRIGENIEPKAWRTNVSLDVCEQRFPRPDL
jgi:hypothetical protein